jgi:hypothetical protein
VRGAAGKVKHSLRCSFSCLPLSTVRGADASGSFARCYLILSMGYLFPDSTMGCTYTCRSLLLYTQ